MTRRGQWNHNTHYHRLILEAIPPGCQRVLDVGCGEGMLARQLAHLVPHVVGFKLRANACSKRSRLGSADEHCLAHASFCVRRPASHGMSSNIAYANQIPRYE